jgi:hypothetical protein
MFIDNTLDQRIGEKLVAENIVEQGNHTSSGRLSASGLGKPLLFSVLKAIGVPGKPLDEYVLRKFRRGHQVEAWVVRHMGNGEAQRFVNYRGVVGYVDFIVDVRDFYKDEDWVQKVGSRLVREIKSVTNMKFKRLDYKGSPEADRSHRLQGTLYALALGDDYYAIDYIASDDFRILSLIYHVKDTKDEVLRIINEFDTHTKNGTLPAFSAPEKWMENPDYADYPEWIGISSEAALRKLQSEFPQQYENLVGYEAYVAGIDAEREARKAEKETV